MGRKQARLNREARHKRIKTELEMDPMLTDEELAKLLGVSISTVRLDRALLGIPEVRERIKTMAQRAVSKLRSLKREEVIGELVELEPNKFAVSTLITTREMAFRHTELVSDHYIYSQASSLAIAVIDEDMVFTGAARVKYKQPAQVGERLVARAKVGTRKGNKYLVSVRTRVGEKEIFVGRFITVVGKDNKDLDLMTERRSG
ncbi:transcription factor FapR [Thermovirga sp.]|uniref:transcription factor FapR n=1 Tax=Thermovirga sp. TaxID=2699834 RepID=UPI0025D8729B|nr:transcription factor FapR [Thermovirga sp.]MBO8153228.1 transcription factor FapR [Thermovirga sp.]